ncbi:MAG: hypothetical protein FRX49_05187 [Trebouxia sp. A1-2]|nr:MAG: hypothetical protein FRX49_05187 [Trebouxia sp. A1-2]
MQFVKTAGFTCHTCSVWVWVATHGEVGMGVGVGVGMGGGEVVSVVWVGVWMGQLNWGEGGVGVMGGEG